MKRIESFLVGFLCVVASAVFAITDGFAADDRFLLAMPKKAPWSADYDWTGFYVGGHMGYAGGNSNWTARPANAALPSSSGSTDMFLPLDIFAEAGSFLMGVQGGYNYSLANRLLLGVEADFSSASFQNLNGLSIGGVSYFNSPLSGPSAYGETVLSFGSVRGRVGYAPSNWLFYLTGGFAWTYDQLTLTQNVSGTSDAPDLWRLGWTAGLGVEVAFAAHWTVKGEYLWSDYPSATVHFPDLGQTVRSNLTLQQLRFGLNYYFNGDAPVLEVAASRLAPLADRFSLHGQATIVDQAYPSFRSPYAGTNSLSGGSQSRETFDMTLFAGVKLWQGAEFWFNPEIDQGYGFNNTHGAAGFPSAESYKLGATYPYARVQRAFLRQTINLGGEIEKVDQDINQFAGSHGTDRLVFTVGRFGVNDIFDTNKYANNPKTDFLNWSMVNAGSFDYAGDGWGFTYGVAAEWYVGHWTLRAGIFDLSATPAGGNSPLAYGLDPTFQQFEWVGEVEERHELWGQPGKIKLTGFLERGSMGAYSSASALAQATGQPADITMVRSYASRPGVSLNFEQQLTDAIGMFGRAGWASPSLEPWDFTDIDRSFQLGAAFSGKLWGRPDDTIGAAAVLNGISSQHVAFLNAGGIGILVGDGQLPHPGLEQIFEAYYSLALNASTKVSLDYQFIANPSYNVDRGPVNAFAARLHWIF